MVRIKIYDVVLILKFTIQLERLDKLSKKLTNGKRFK